jgi:hypothetical protein
MRQSQQRAFVVSIVLSLLTCTSCARLHSGSPDAQLPKPAVGSSGNPSQELGDALTRLKTAYPYRVTDELIQSGSSSSTTGKYVVEYAAADRAHYKSDSHETIEIGDKRYAYYSGKWVETGPAAKGPTIEETISEHMADVRQEGAEEINGVPCSAYTTRYQFDTKGLPGSGTSKIWISKLDGLPRQLDSKIKQDPISYTSHKVYEYDSSIRVEKPIP